MEIKTHNFISKENAIDNIYKPQLLYQGFMGMKLFLDLNGNETVKKKKTEQPHEEEITQTFITYIQTSFYR